MENNGLSLLDYTSKELDVLLNAIAMDRVRSKYSQGNTFTDTLDQWATKIIEAKSIIRTKEITTEN